ncbi:hypothetical protein [Halopelagius fulvigenes]|uniref:Secreted protein n=1 Tax=Halopelagius fulvigenes TaxID=1198324 RepID=A0ABD5U0L7_9EURY
MDNNHHNTSSSESTAHGHGRPAGHADAGSHALPGGLTVAANGLRFDASETRLDAGVRREWTYRIRDEDGDAVTEFEETHDRLAHLVLVRRDLTRFQHLHPELRADGTWSVEFSLPDPGVYRGFVDVLVGGRPTTLGADLLVSGAADYDAPPEPTREVTVDGYDLTMTPGDVAPNENVTLEFEVRTDGSAARLDPYLGALGHLVALRDGDLAYLHVHPEETDPEDGLVRFAVRFPTAGRYRLFLQAKPRGELITASFDVVVETP